MATSSAYLDTVRRELGRGRSSRSSPIQTCRLRPRKITPGDGPRVAFAGFPSDYSLAFLLRLLELDYQPVGIVTSPGAHPAILGDNALSRIADHLGIPLIRAWRINDEHSRFELEELGLDAVVMASFDQIVGPRALAIPKHGWLNGIRACFPRTAVPSRCTGPSPTGCRSRVSPCIRPRRRSIRGRSLPRRGFRSSPPTRQGPSPGGWQQRGCRCCLRRSTACSPMRQGSTST